nr:Hedgehog receptor, putative isoform 2 [Ipomoea batatas]
MEFSPGGRRLSFSLMACFAAALFLQVLFSVSKVTAQTSNGERHSEGYCAMYDICGHRSDGKVLNCPLVPHLLSLMICSHPRFKVCAQLLLEMSAVQRLSLTL